MSHFITPINSSAMELTESSLNDDSSVSDFRGNNIASSSRAGSSSSTDLSDNGTKFEKVLKELNENKSPFKKDDAYDLENDEYTNDHKELIRWANKLELESMDFRLMANKITKTLTNTGEELKKNLKLVQINAAQSSKFINEVDSRLIQLDQKLATFMKQQSSPIQDKKLDLILGNQMKIMNAINAQFSLSEMMIKVSNISNNLTNRVNKITQRIDQQRQITIKDESITKKRGKTNAQSLELQPTTQRQTRGKSGPATKKKPQKGKLTRKPVVIPKQPSKRKASKPSLPEPPKKRYLLTQEDE